MKMSNNTAKYEVLIKQYLHSILDNISNRKRFIRSADFAFAMQKEAHNCVGQQGVYYNNGISLYMYK